MKTPLSEYPNPQFQRDSYISLNGYWEYKISKSDVIPTSFGDKILVPYSPETKMSGVNHLLMPDEYLFYKLEFKVPFEFIKDKIFLHFLAVDQIADVYLNGHYLGKHVGGYLPFKFEIKSYLKENNILIVKVQDLSDTSYHSSGKQKLEHGGIWYTPTSGIWLPVYLESVYGKYIESIKFTPDIDKSELILEINSNEEKCLVEINNKKLELATNIVHHIHIDNMHLWTPTDPYLYPLIISTSRDKISSYFAMRKYSIIEKNGHKLFALNNVPLYLNGVLDQGYYQEGYLTPNNYNDYINDIELAKSLGFNMMRKHIKIEAPRFYYECDKRGMIVFQDFVNGSSPWTLLKHILPLFTHIHLKDTNYKRFYRDNIEGRKETINEFKETISYLYNYPSIALWTIFNEGWGQFDAKKILLEMEKLDKSRLFDHASGWHDQKVGNIKSLHVYFQKVRLPRFDKRLKYLSEFGGLVLPIKGHMMDGDSVYRKFSDPQNFINAYKELINRDVIKNIKKGLAISVYTQLRDVEEEVNGFITFDRQIIKINQKDINEINQNIYQEFNKIYLK